MLLRYSAGKMSLYRVFLSIINSKVDTDLALSLVRNERSRYDAQTTPPSYTTPANPIPANTHVRNTTVPPDIPSIPTRTSAGPGHIPARPHPAPKITEPMINRLSIFWAAAPSGICHLPCTDVPFVSTTVLFVAILAASLPTAAASSRYGSLPRPILGFTVHSQFTIFGTTPNNTTIPKLGSQSAHVLVRALAPDKVERLARKGSRMKPRVFKGDTIPLMRRPKPNVKPERRERMRSDVLRDDPVSEGRRPMTA